MEAKRGREDSRYDDMEGTRRREQAKRKSGGEE
jgi:hypothetical protein